MTTNDTNNTSQEQSPAAAPAADAGTTPAAEDRSQALLVVGRTDGAYGLNGSVRVVPFENGEVLGVARKWFIRNIRGQIREVDVRNVKVHGTLLLAKFAGVDSKEAADRLRGNICVMRRDFPEADEGQHWAADVIGCRVVNREGVELGTVADVGSNTVQDIFKVRGPVPAAGGKPVEYLIPDVPDYVLEIDVGSGVVTVDWQPDWV